MKKTWAHLFGYKSDNHPSEIPLVELLSRVPIFTDLNRRDLESIERILHRREYVEGEIIFRQGEPGMGMYIVQHGTVEILSEPENQELSEMMDGDFFGEVALLDASPRSATAIAKTDCSLFGFFQPDLFGLIEHDPRLGVKIVLRVARHIGERLRLTNDRLLAFSQELEKVKRIMSRRKH